MTTQEQKMHQNVAGWRAMSISERRSILHASNVKRVASSMAMEGEPVSDEWLKKYHAFARNRINMTSFIFELGAFV